jgi:hypothetical protein
MAWLAAWLLLMQRWPAYYKRNRQPLVLVMRCGMMMSEARALRDGGARIMQAAHMTYVTRVVKWLQEQQQLLTGALWLAHEAMHHTVLMAQQRRCTLPTNAWHF